MNEERRMILEMVREGSVTVQEAERLLEALPEIEKTYDGEAALMARPTGMPKRLVVLVTEGGRAKVNVKIPFSLLRVGLKLGKSFGSIGQKHSKDPADAEAFEMLNNLDVDELLASISDGDITLPYVMVDADDEEKGQHVTVTLE
ncbi:hypothetical protein LJC34_01610 [Oscillospiraceae bacterium OttesenSCG-928-G22]|nr:hypothetical protein [Oscillospiraceae bacterium OttesenSCG-928-G22]